MKLFQRINFDKRILKNRWSIGLAIGANEGSSFEIDILCSSCMYIIFIWRKGYIKMFDFKKEV